MSSGRSLPNYKGNDMHIAKMLNVFLVFLTLTLIGIETKWAIAEEIRPLQSIIADLERQIGELTLNIEKIKKRIEFLQTLPPSNDSVIQELRDLDLKGWKLHLEQWNLQLEHLQFAETMLQQVQASPEDHSKLKLTWGPRESQYRENLEAYRNQRDKIEEQRLITEGKMIERYLP